MHDSGNCNKFIVRWFYMSYSRMFIFLPSINVAKLIKVERDVNYRLVMSLGKFALFIEADTRRFSIKNVFWKIPKCPQESTCGEVSLSVSFQRRCFPSKIPENFLKEYLWWLLLSLHKQIFLLNHRSSKQ